MYEFKHAAHAHRHTQTPKLIALCALDHARLAFNHGRIGSMLKPATCWTMENVHCYPLRSMHRRRTRTQNTYLRCAN